MADVEAWAAHTGDVQRGPGSLTQGKEWEHQLEVDVLEGSQKKQGEDLDNKGAKELERWPSG